MQTIIVSSFVFPVMLFRILFLDAVNVFSAQDFATTFVPPKAVPYRKLFWGGVSFGAWYELSACMQQHCEENLHDAAITNTMKQSPRIDSSDVAGSLHHATILYRMKPTRKRSSDGSESWHHSTIMSNAQSTKNQEFAAVESSDDAPIADAPPLSSYRSMPITNQDSHNRGGTPSPLPKNVRQLPVPGRHQMTKNSSMRSTNKKSTRTRPSDAAETKYDSTVSNALEDIAASSSSHGKSTSSIPNSLATPTSDVEDSPEKGEPTDDSTTTGRHSSKRLSLIAVEKTKKIGATILDSERRLAHVADKTAKQITQATTKQIGSALKHSERAYESSRWCFFARFIGQFPKHFPRVFSFTFGVLVPLWLLILISAGFGIILSSYEATEEKIVYVSGGSC